MYEIFVLIAAISIFYTLKLTYLKEYRFQVGCSGCIAIYFYSVSIACLAVDITMLISTTQIMEEIDVVEIIDGRVIATIWRRIIDVIIIGRITHIFVSAAIEYILTLLFCITLCRIAHTHTCNLLCNRSHGMDIGMKCSCLITTLSQYITGKISCYFLLFIIIRELDAKCAFKRRYNSAYTLVREIAAVGYHIKHVCLYLELADFCLDADTCNLAAIIAYFTYLHMLGCTFWCAKSQFLHILILGFHDINLSTATTAFQP